MKSARWVAAAAIAALAASLFVASPTQAKPVFCSTTAAPEREIRTPSADGTSISVVRTNMTDRQLAARPMMQVFQSGGNAGDSSPTWTNSDGRVYWYNVNAAVYFVTSDPCSGPDEFYSWFNITCRRRLGGGNPVDSICEFDAVFSSLQVAAPGSGGSSWTARGWHKYVRASDTECEGLGGKHTEPNGTWARTRVVEHLYFLQPAGLPGAGSRIHSTVRRGMGSYWINQLGETVGSDAWTGTLVSANNPTSWIGPSLC